MKVVVDSRVSTGDYFMFDSTKIRAIPLGSRGMFVKQAPELKDAKRARVLGEWTLECRHPSCVVNGHSKT